MAAPDEVFVSDVHVYSAYDEKDGKRTASSRFKISRKRKIFGESMKDSHEEDTELSGLQDLPQTDEDGDFIVTRREPSVEVCDIITVEHLVATPLKDVGLQVWRGALLLCDFLVENVERFEGCCALELGGGIGLCSIVMGRVAQHVFCTDIGEDVLRNCQQNIQINSHLYKHGKSVVTVKEFDWLQSSLPSDQTFTFHWNEDDKQELMNVSVVIAADVIYDNLLTDGFLNTVSGLLIETNGTLYLAIEKRLNFTLEDLDVACPAYNHFRETMSRHSSLRARQLLLDFPQFFEYDRVKELVSGC